MCLGVIFYAPISFSLPTFKLVIDNLDKNIKPGAGNIRINHQTKSLHYTRIYAVKDQIDLTPVYAQYPALLCLIHVIYCLFNSA